MPLDALPREVLLQITDSLRQTSRATLARLSLTNSDFRALAEYSAHRCVKWDLGYRCNETAVAERCERIRRHGLLPAVRKLVVNHDSEYEASCRSLQAVCGLVGAAPGLHEIEYKGTRMPEDLVSALRAVPSAKLSVSVTAFVHRSHIGDGDAGSDMVAGLIGSQQLRALSMTVTYTDAEECLQVMRPLKRLLLSCPNLRTLSLDVGQPSGGCVMYAPPHTYCGLGFQDREMLPPLEELCLLRYPFGPLERDAWAQRFDWSRLKRLKTSDPKFALKIVSKLTALQECEFVDMSNGDESSRFLSEVPRSLTKISGPPYISTMEAALRHSSTLQGLHIHGLERSTANWREQVMDRASLSRVREECPHISNLTLDLARDGSWPEAELQVLASFPHLETLHIWFNLASDSPGHPAEPYSTIESTCRLFEYLQSHHTTGESPLKTLTVHSGAPGPCFGYPAPATMWHMNNSTKFSCSVPEYAGDANFGIYAVDCAALEWEKREKRRRMAQSRKSVKPREEMNMFELFAAAREANDIEERLIREELGRAHHGPPSLR